MQDQKNLPKTFKIVMDNNHPPYVFLDGKEDLPGILIDHWRLWEQKTGIRTHVSGMIWDEALNRMEAGEFDVIDTIFFNKQRAQIYDFSGRVTSTIPRWWICVYSYSGEKDIIERELTRSENS